MHETGVTALVAVPQLFYLLHKGIFEQIGRRPPLVRALLRLFLRLSGALRPTGINLGRLVFGQVHRRFGGRIRIMASGGARLDPIIARDFLALGFTLTEGYGLTETAPVVAFNPLARIVPGSVGVPLPGVEVRIVTPDAEGVGEIAIRGPNVMQGYYQHALATAEVLRDGWFLSGDLGKLTPDGYLIITGRAKEVIVLSSGKNIYPEEIEEQYLKSAYIKEICLVPQISERAGATWRGCWPWSCRTWTSSRQGADQHRRDRSAGTWRTSARTSPPTSGPPDSASSRRGSRGHGSGRSSATWCSSDSARTDHAGGGSHRDDRAGGGGPGGAGGRRRAAGACLPARGDQETGRPPR